LFKKTDAAEWRDRTALDIAAFADNIVLKHGQQEFF